ncbi:YheU family protein [Vibrio hepatarius]|uniref:YheU family protein n=1 Tax=Vibrio hepatarius TaxID=171383 RepID=UPI001C08293D|nr:YheU family protein [Vibrio hepatarius]MBU2895306.1 YheU family protein [Vibrio hepatarius]
MIVPWQQIAPETLDNLIQEFILREGTDYGVSEVSLPDKIDQVKHQLASGEAVVVFSELHDTVDIQLKQKFSF